MQIEINEEQAEVCKIALREALEREGSITAQLRINKVLTHLDQSSVTKGIRVIDVDGEAFDYIGAEITQFDDEGRLLVIKGGVTAAVFNSHIWHHAQNI